MANHSFGKNKIYDYTKKLSTGFRGKPEHELAANILLRSIIDLTESNAEYSCGTRRNVARNEAIDWFHYNAIDPWPFTYENICSILDIDHERLRSVLITYNLLPSLGDRENVMAGGLRRKN